MTDIMKRYLKHFYIPIGVFSGVILISFIFSHVWIAYDSLFVLMPYLLLIAGGVAALYLLQYAIVYTCILFVFTYWVIQTHLLTILSEPFVFAIYTCVNILFPLLLLACVFLGRKTIKSLFSVVLVLLFSSLFFLSILIDVLGIDTWIQTLPSLLIAPIGSGVFSAIMLISYVPVMLFLILYYIINPLRLHALWLVGLIMILTVFAFFETQLISALGFSVFSILVLVVLFQEVYSLAYVDELTNISSRKACEKQLLSMGRNYCIAMIDVDHFKNFNDTYGHNVGDQVLKMIALKIDSVEGGGKAYRYGGEEFIILFPSKTINESLKYLEQVRVSIARYSIQLRDLARPIDNSEGESKERVHKKKD